MKEQWLKRRTHALLAVLTTGASFAWVEIVADSPARSPARLAHVVLTILAGVLFGSFLIRKDTPK